jgi:hypothetical protein
MSVAAESANLKWNPKKMTVTTCVAFSIHTSAFTAQKATFGISLHLAWQKVQKMDTRSTTTFLESAGTSYGVLTTYG